MTTSSYMRLLHLSEKPINAASLADTARAVDYLPGKAGRGERLRPYGRDPAPLSQVYLVRDQVFVLRASEEYGASNLSTGAHGEYGTVKD
jgi:hypothetical protein